MMARKPAEPGEDAMNESALASRQDQSHSPERRTLLRWLGAATLILPTALAACANSVPPRQVKRTPSHITGNDHRDGSSEPNRTIWITW